MPMLKTPDATLAYEIDGNGPPVVLIQGVGLTGKAWQPQLDDLRKDHQVLWFDNRGIGASLPLTGPLTVQAMARDVLALMDHAGWHSAHIVGHSMGGIIAHQTALEAPGRARSLSLLCTFARGKDAARLTGDILWMGLRTSIGTRRMRRMAFLDLVMPPGHLAAHGREAVAARLESIFGRGLAEQPKVAFQHIRAMARHDESPRLSSLAGIPTLVASGKHDRIALPKYGRELAAAIPGAEYVEFSEGGHAVVVQQADEVNRLLRRHIAAAAARAPLSS